MPLSPLFHLSLLKHTALPSWQIVISASCPLLLSSYHGVALILMAFQSYSSSSTLGRFVTGNLAWGKSTGGPEEYPLTRFLNSSPPVPFASLFPPIQYPAIPF